MHHIDIDYYDASLEATPMVRRTPPHGNLPSERPGEALPERRIVRTQNQ